jgi:hypothetical protein
MIFFIILGLVTSFSKVTDVLAREALSNIQSLRGAFSPNATNTTNGS